MLPFFICKNITSCSLLSVLILDTKFRILFSEWSDPPDPPPALLAPGANPELWIFCRTRRAICVLIRDLNSTIKGIVTVISSVFPYKKGNARFKTESFKFPLIVHELKRALYLNIIKSTRIPEKRDVRCVQ